MDNNRRALLRLAAGLAVATKKAISNPVESRTVRKQPLPAPFAGWEARYVEVRFPGGVASVPHRHPGFVLGYVLDGEFRFAVDGQPPQVLRSGEAFYEAPGVNHTTGESASQSRPARILAIIVAPVEQQG